MTCYQPWKLNLYGQKCLLGDEKISEMSSRLQISGEVVLLDNDSGLLDGGLSGSDGGGSDGTI